MMEARADINKVTAHLKEMFSNFPQDMQQAIVTGYCLGLIDSMKKESGEQDDDRKDN